MPNPKLVRYAPTGRLRPWALVLAALACGAAAVLGFAYAWLSAWTASAAFAVVLPMLVAAALGSTLSRVIRIGHVRSPAFAIVAGAFVGCVAVAASHIAAHEWWIRAAAHDRADQSFILSLETRVSTGWIVGGWLPFSGPAVLGGWLLELVVLVGVPVRQGLVDVRRAYCERCDTWPRAIDTELRGVPRERIEALLDSGDLAGLVAMESPAKERYPTVSVLTTLRCDSCTATWMRLGEDVANRDEGRELLQNFIQLIDGDLVLEGELANQLRSRR